MEGTSLLTSLPWIHEKFPFLPK